MFALNTVAFESDGEAKLVDQLRVQADPVISLVAESDDRITGHILFSPVTTDPPTSLSIMGLAPMAVSPDLQRTGIGSRLVETGLEQCRKAGVDAVVVLGHPSFYPKFGFVSAPNLGFHSEYDVPEDAFLMLEIKPGILKDAAGLVKYHPAFADV
ncbi:MAG: GNAT family N-acetyltransferase [Robiginitomaculum sp.]|nr:MAG: GNAT family N-acetyltransferase [Robiginitomaculum sp.]